MSEVEGPWGLSRLGFMPSFYGWALGVHETLKTHTQMLCTVRVCLEQDPELHKMLKEVSGLEIVGNL